MREGETIVHPFCDLTRDRTLKQLTRMPRPHSSRSAQQNCCTIQEHSTECTKSSPLSGLRYTPIRNRRWVY